MPSLVTPTNAHVHTCSHRSPGLMYTAHQMREPVCWPRSSDLYHSVRDSQRTNCIQGIGKEKGGALWQQPEMQGERAQARGNHCKLSFWLWWRKAKVVGGRGLTMEEVTDPGANGSPPGTHRKKIISGEPCSCPSSLSGDGYFSFTP